MIWSRFGTLSVASAIGLYLLIVLGATVRVTGSGLGCPDWPLCHGQLIPPPDPAAILEYSHRTLAALVSALIVVTVAVALIRHRKERLIAVPMLAVLPLLLLQIGLGAVTVALELPPMIVLVHLSLAMILLALVIIASLTSLYLPDTSPSTKTFSHRPAPRDISLVRWTGVALFGLLLSGAFVRATGATWACAGFPLCDGELILGSRLVDIHMLHRIAATVVGLLLLYTVWIIAGHRDARQRILVSAILVSITLAVQIGIGIWAVSTEVPALMRGLHVAGSAGVWSAYVVFMVLASRTTSGAADIAASPAAADNMGDRAWA